MVACSDDGEANNKGDDSEWPSSDCKIYANPHDDTHNEGTCTALSTPKSTIEDKPSFEHNEAGKSSGACSGLGYCPGASDLALNQSTENVSNASNPFPKNNEMDCGHLETPLSPSTQAEGSLGSNRVCTTESLDSCSESPNEIWEHGIEEDIKSGDGQSSDISFGDFEGTLEEVLGLVQGTKEPFQNRSSEVSTTSTTSK